MKLTTIKVALTCLALAGMSGIADAQTITTLGGTAPIPGANDISQFSTAGNASSPDSIGNYYIDNWQSPGQTFTTGNNLFGYVFNSVAFKTSTGGGGGIEGVQPNGFNLNLYSISGGTATLIQTYNVGAGTFSGWTQGDWLKVSGMSAVLSPNATYAWTFQRPAGDNGWDNLAVASGNPYAGGEICMIQTPPGSSAVALGATHVYDNVFDIGLSLGSPQAPVLGVPTASPNPCYALSPVVITDAASLATSFRWQTNSLTDGSHGGTWVDCGQTTLSITNTPPDAGTSYTVSYQLIAGNSFNSTTSAPVDLVVQAATVPFIVNDTAPASATAFSGGSVSFTASFDGTHPITNIWQTDAGQTGTFTNIPGATGTTLTLNNLLVGNSGNYRLSASNVKGTTPSTPANLLVKGVIYKETFDVVPATDTPIDNVGWKNDTTGSPNRIFSNNQNVTGPNCAVYSYDGSAAVEAFYATTRTENGLVTNNNQGTLQAALPIIDPATTANLVFGVDINSPWNGGLCGAYFAVQMDWGQWYVSQTEITGGAAQWNWATFQMPWSATGWNLLTVSTNGTIYLGGGTAPYPLVGADGGTLTGKITGVGLVTTKSTGATIQLDNFLVSGTLALSTLPVISAIPVGQTVISGNTATFDVVAATNGSTAGLSYQWKAGTVGSGVYANLSNGGQFSGVNTRVLTINNVQSANAKDYICVVTDGAGSVDSSAHPATLTVQQSAPILTSDTTIYPDASLGFGAGTFAVYAGNHNTLNLTASYKGSSPMSLQWQVSPNADGSAAVNVSGATNSTLVLSDPQPSASGYYSLKASNSQGGPTNSAWAQLTVSPADPTLIHWSKPVPFNGLAAAQILENPPGTFFEAEVFGGTTPISFVLDGTDYVFNTDGSVAAIVGGVGNRTGAYTGPSTGNTIFDSVLNICNEVSGGYVVTVNNLTPGTLYSFQLFAFDDSAATLRQGSFSDATVAADVSPAILMGDNAYIVGTFVANAATEGVTMNFADTHGYFGSVIVRQAKPTVTTQMSGSNMNVSWDFGTLQEATSINGPWTTDTGITSPHAVTASGPTAGTQKYFRVVFP